MKKWKWKQILLHGILLVLLIFLDQFTKHLAGANLTGGRDLVIWDHVFRLTYVENFGAAFGTMENSRVFLLVTTSILMIYILFLYVRLAARNGYRILRSCCIAILAGGIGNMIDRVRLGYVIDFLYFELIDFPVFNVADCYITCAVAVLMISMIFIYKESDMDLLIPFGKDKTNES
ncbi:MAG: signal peptidase II [Lachnospiraceae bacterium]|nr:signal peptidase II [Lachnospiraceae bacterium]